jgi:hypothetical protein
MLHAPEEYWLINKDTIEDIPIVDDDGITSGGPIIWQEIVNQRYRFYTKNLYALVSYVRKQAAKYGIKGSRLATLEEAIVALSKYTSNQELKLGEIDNLPVNEHACWYPSSDPRYSMYQIVGRQFQSNMNVKNVLPILQKIYDEYGERARLAASNEGIDWKAMSHAVRAANEIAEILTHGTITFPRPEAALLRDIKLGKLDFVSTVEPLLSSLLDGVSILSENSNLPNEVDREYWDQFVIDTLTEYVF